MAIPTDSDLARLDDVARVLIDDVRKRMDNTFQPLLALVPGDSKVMNLSVEAITELCQKLPDSFVDQFWAHALVRSSFALFEGVLYEIKMLVLKAHQRGEVVLTEGEAAVMSDSIFDIGDNGGVTARPRVETAERSSRRVPCTLERASR